MGVTGARLADVSACEKVAVLARVRYIVDCDGYSIGGVFYPCEISVVDLCTKTSRKWALSVPAEVVRGMSAVDRRSADYVYNKVHGMAMVRSGPDVRTLDETLAERRGVRRDGVYGGRR